MSIDPQLLWSSTWDTLYMVFAASVASVFLGLCLGLLLYVSARDGVWANKHLYRALSFIVNVGRSIPFVILMIALIPITRFLVGTSIGTNASIIPLTVAAIPFYARIAESAFKQVPQGLLEAAKAMGLTPWQTIIKVVVPESKVILLEGATLTVIALIAYSSIVGMIGGGGLGDVAIRYGYQRFDLIMMFATIVILVVLVQFVQWLGDLSAKKRSVLFWGLLSIPLLLGSVAHEFYNSESAASNTLTVGIVGGPMEQVLQVAQQVAEKQYGVKLKVVVFNDYVLPNQALNNGDIDANIFQHQPYLDTQSKAHGYKISALTKTFVYPLGFYSIKIKSLNQLPDGGIVAVPNDPSNEGRALNLLATTGIIKLTPGIGLFPTPQNIIANPKHLKFKELDAADVPRALQDVSMGAITNDYITVAHFTVNQALIHEGPNVPYANIVAVQTSRLTDSKLQALIPIMHSPEVLKETQALFPNGAAIPAW
jgi:D-methionine transport system substrate-binding protein